MMNVLGCKTVADLKKVDVKRFLEASAVAGLRIWAERDGDYLPLDPYEAYANGAAKDLDFIQGCNKDVIRRIPGTREERLMKLPGLLRPLNTRK